MREEEALVTSKARPLVLKLLFSHDLCEKQSLEVRAKLVTTALLRTIVENYALRWTLSSKKDREVWKKLCFSHGFPKRRRFILDCIVLIFSKPSGVKCSPRNIRCTASLKPKKSIFLSVFRLCFSKKGSTTSYNSESFRTRNWKVFLFFRTVPMFCIDFFIAYKTETFRVCWVTTNSHRTWFSFFIFEFLFIPTWKHPSPSTKPTIQLTSKSICLLLLNVKSLRILFSRFFVATNFFWGSETSEALVLQSFSLSWCWQEVKEASKNDDENDEQSSFFFSFSSVPSLLNAASLQKRELSLSLSCWLFP